MDSTIKLPAGCEVVAGNNGLPKLKIRTSLADAEIYLHGAHVTHFQPAHHKPVIWLSAKSWFEAGKPIRGGVPICFPWFGPNPTDPAKPAHGFARLRDWTLKSVTAGTAGDVVAELELISDDETKKLWPAEFVATYRVTVGKTLTMELTIKNTGPTPARFTEALHTYVAIGDIKQVRITGLAGASYLDKARGTGPHVQDENPIRFASETDRPYLATIATATLHDDANGRTITIAKAGSRSTVVWNPWIAKSKAMTDFGDDEWPGMVCVETANVMDDAIELQPGAVHTIRATVDMQL